MSDSRGGLFLEIAVPQNSGSSETGGKWDGERRSGMETWRADTVGCAYVCVKQLSKQHTKGSQGHGAQCC